MRDNEFMKVFIMVLQLSYIFFSQVNSLQCLLYYFFF